MSYGLDMVVDHGDGYATNVLCQNITYNIRPMLVAAGLPDSLHTLHGMTAADALPIVEGVWRELYRHPYYYRQFDAPNGWGKHVHTLPWIRALYLNCRLHPTAVITIS